MLKNKEYLRKQVYDCLNKINETNDLEEFDRLNNYIDYYINEFSRLNFLKMEDIFNERN